MAVGGQAATLNALASLQGQASYDDDYDPQAELRVWTGSGYYTYEWSGALSTEQPDLAEELGGDDGSLDNQWLDAYDTTDETLGVGVGFWVKASGTGSVTLVGEVPVETTVSKNLSAGLNLVAYPWPMTASLSKIQLSGEPSYDDDYDPQCELRVWTGSGYYTYEWSGALSTEQPDLAEELGGDDGSLDNQWLDAYDTTDATIPAGIGFWIKAANVGTITFSK